MEKYITPSIKIKKPKREYENIKEKDFANILKHCHIKKYRIIFILAYGSGLRLSEILNLQKDDINFENKTIHVRQGKGCKDRETILTKYFRKDYYNYIPFNLSKVIVQKNFLIITRDKLKINRVIDTYKTKAGKVRNIYRYHFHCLRHSFGTNLLEAGVPLNHVQRLMGHSNISTTSQYLRVGAKDAINKAMDIGF